MDFGRDYKQDFELAKQFLREMTEVDEEGMPQPKYVPRMEQLANREALHMFIELADVEKFNQDLTKAIIENTVRYTKIFYSALDELLPIYKTREPEFKDPMDVFIEQRLLVAERNQRANQNLGSSQPGPTNSASLGPTSIVDIDGKYPPDLIRRAEIYFKPINFQATPIRQVRADMLGHFVTVRGIVTRASEVKSRITVATYTCDQCGCESFQPIGNTNYTPLFECTSAVCKSNKALGRLTAQTRGSKFVKCQEVKLQEHSDQVPIGHIPMAITVIVCGELTRNCAPGDHISVSGPFLPIERTGYRSRSSGLTSDTYVEAHYITQMNKTEDEELGDEPMSMEEAHQLVEGEENFLHKLSSSIAPEIFGHTELKKALLLLLVGGVDKSPHGMKIRGNINICLMGDPGMAKSQLLIFVDRLASRSQYTTGRGSSGVGLTAAVLKDPVTGELVLEGGALVLADQGICCIDEFDKMLEADRTAIHEVMEQQTVSIAKAGIMTTLNARVSILAAANPAFGRYNMTRSVADNLDLPPALLSRFDLLWLIKDKIDREKDLELANHVTNVHAGTVQEIETASIDMKVMRKYISLCKTKTPDVPRHLTDKLVKIYQDIRAQANDDSKDGSLFTSPRSLLAILRLSTAFARLRLAETVEEADVDAAYFLYNNSKESIDNSGSARPTNTILDILRELAAGERNRGIPLSSIYEEADSRKLSRQEAKQALRILEENDAIFNDGEEIMLI